MQIARIVGFSILGIGLLAFGLSLWELFAEARNVDLWGASSSGFAQGQRAVALAELGIVAVASLASFLWWRWKRTTVWIGALCGVLWTLVLADFLFGAQAGAVP